MKMKKALGVCDYFLIASGASTTQVRAIAEHITRSLKAKGERLWHGEGEREASWILLDYGDVVVHIFLDATRRFYDLERLWGDAPQERFEEQEIPKKAKRRVAVRRKALKKSRKRRPK